MKLCTCLHYNQNYFNTTDTIILEQETGVLSIQ